MVVVLQDGDPLPAELLSSRGNTLVLAVPLPSVAQNQLDLGVIVKKRGEQRKARVLTRVLAQRREPLRCVVRVQADMVHGSDPSALATVVSGLFQQPWVPGRARKVPTGFLYTLSPAARRMVLAESVPTIGLSCSAGPQAEDLAFDGQADDTQSQVTMDSAAIDLSADLTKPFEALATRPIGRARAAVRERRGYEVGLQTRTTAGHGVPLSYRLRSDQGTTRLARVRGVKAEGVLLTSDDDFSPPPAAEIQLRFPLGGTDEDNTILLQGHSKPYPGVAGAFVVKLVLVPGAPSTERWLRFLKESGKAPAQ